MDRPKYLKANKDDLKKFCKKKNLDTSDCFAKIDFVNLLLLKRIKYKEFKNSNNVQYASLKSGNNNNNNNNNKNNSKIKKLKRTATRFCVDAQIDENEQLDLAEFILAARYLGTDANDDQLMNVFMDNMDNNNNNNQIKPKQLIKDLIKKVDDKYGDNNDNDDDAITKLDTSVYSDPDKDDIYNYNPDLHEQEIDDFLIKTQKDQNLIIAQNLLNTTMLTRHEIAEITGVDPNELKNYESDDYDTSDDDDDGDYQTDDDDDDDKQHTKQKTVKITGVDVNNIDNSKFTNLSGNPLDGVEIIGSGNKSVVINKNEMNKLKEITDNNNKDIVINEATSVLNLLTKFRNAINMGPGSMKRAKTMAKLNLNKLYIGNSDVDADVDQDIFPISYRVVIYPGALCKEDITLKGKDVGKIKIGEEVIVEEINVNRARISSPFNGWISIKSSSDNSKIIIQKSSIKSDEMTKAIQAFKTRQTQILILKSITHLHDITVQRILEKSKWNTRVAVDSFFIAKFKTKEFINKNNKYQIINPNNIKQYDMNRIRRLSQQQTNDLKQNIDNMTNALINNPKDAIRRYSQTQQTQNNNNNNIQATIKEENIVAIDNNNNNNKKKKKKGWWKAWKAFHK